MAEPYDLIVIGGGPGGYVAAIRAAQLGLRTAVVEREHLGGICLNWGCIPTKALLRSAEIFHYLQHPKDYGLTVEGTVGFDPAAVISRSRGVSQQLTGGVAFLLKKNKVDVIWGEATIPKPGEVVVGKPKKPAMQPQNPPPKGTLGEGTYAAKHIVIATGARPRVLPGIEPDQKLIWTYFEAMVPKTFPKSLIVMGSGAIGIEFASFYATMGCAVTVVEVLPQILPVEDAEIAALARKRFEKQGIAILTATKVTKVEKGADDLVATLEDDKGKTQTLRAERMISAVGVVGNIESIGLEKLGVTLERGLIKIDGLRPHQRAGPLRDRRCRGTADAGPQGRARGRHLRGDHRGQARPSDGQDDDSRLHLLPAAGRLGRHDRSQGEGGGLHAQGRALSLHRQRQGDRARRTRRARQDDLRCQDRQAARRPHGRRGGDGADPGLRRRHELRDDRGGADAHDLPASRPSRK